MIAAAYHLSAQKHSLPKINRAKQKSDVMCGCGCATALLYSRLVREQQRITRLKRRESRIEKIAVVPRGVQRFTTWDPSSIFLKIDDLGLREQRRQRRRAQQQKKLS